MHDNEKNPVLGIDLGTTFSAIARWDGRGPDVYQLLMGRHELQSAVYYDPKKDEFLVGRLAFQKGSVNPENLALGIKRHMDNAEQKISIGGKDFTPIELSSRILETLYVQVAARFPKGFFKCRGTVVTVPYYLKAHQCENTRKAADLANISCIGILQEPIAASLSYAWKLTLDHPTREVQENILVFDLGGGTFDLTLFRLTQTKDKLAFEVLATGGDDRLGGMDFDELMGQLLLKKAKVSINDLSPLEKRRARQKLMDKAIDAKETLSFIDETIVVVPYLTGTINLETTVTRTEFQESLIPYIKKIEGCIESLWATSGQRSADVHRVIRVGGSSRIPCMKQLLDDMIGEDKVFDDPDPSLAVVKGAALYAAHLDDPEVLGREVEITTRTCHALGVEVSGGLFDIVIASNRKAPCTGESLFGTVEDNQKTLDINVYQGSKPHVKDNTLIGTIKIRDLPPYPKGKLDIKVTFEITKDQHMIVSVKVSEDVGGKVLREERCPMVYA
jgi:molecular chaperone DnaK